MTRRGNWIQTYTGRAYWPESPLAQDVFIEDIAHHLALLCRYTGACSRFYSVAEHSVLVSLLVDKKHALTGLLHDATEAYINDISRPVKRAAGMEGYRQLEALNWSAIALRFGLPIDIPDEVHCADEFALFHERAALLPPSPDYLEWGAGLRCPAIVRPELVSGWCWEEAEEVFLRRYQELTE